MSNMEPWISITGSLASIGAAVWAFYEAHAAARSASKAEQVRDEMINRRGIVEVSQVYNETKRILSSVSRIGPSSNPNILTGIDNSGIAREIEEYARFLNEHSSHFTAFFENTAKNLCEDINGDIAALSEAQSPQQIKEMGSRIYNKINSFLPTAKSLADERRESIVVSRIRS